MPTPSPTRPRQALHGLPASAAESSALRNTAYAPPQGGGGEIPTRADFRRWAKAALKTDVAATLRIVDAEEGLALNRDYRGKAYATNVLTFEYGPDPETGALTGDIVLCAPVVEKEAREQGKDLAVHYAHLTVHGLLHLQGYDHETNEADAIAMEALESFIMQRLGFPNPYQ